MRTKSRQPRSSRPQAVITLAVAAVALIGLFALAARHLSALLPAPVTDQTGADHAASVPQSEPAPRVLIFFDPSRADCAECALHTWRFAYYTRDFEQQGAQVYGVVEGLRDGRPQLDDELGLPWETIYDLSGRLAWYYGVDVQKSAIPTVVIVDAQDRVVYRARPRDSEDRLEGDIMTTLLALRDGLPEDGPAPTVAHAR